MRVAIYARVSTKDKGQDPLNQLKQLRQYATRMDYEVIKEYVDHVSAGGVKAREQFNLFLVEARQREFDAVLFWSLDRFSREGILKTLQYLNELATYKVAWISFTEKFIDSTGPLGELMVAFLATMAKQERVRISERVKAGLERTVAAGTILGRKLVTDAGRKGKTANLEQIKALSVAGKSVREISRITGITKSSVDRLLRGNG